MDVVDNLINDLKQSEQYVVTEVGPDGETSYIIDHYRALNSKYDESKVINEINASNIVTCAVGPKILKFIAPHIVNALIARSNSDPLVVIACENAIMATDILKSYVLERLPQNIKANLDQVVRFANCAIDRIVPTQRADAGLNIKIEKFHEWCIETKPFMNVPKPDISQVKYVDDLSPYIERKLFTVNTGHAAAAYYGFSSGKEYIHEAMGDINVRKAVRDCVEETGNLIVKKFGIDPKEQAEYIQKIIDRISNSALNDVVTRVGRAPLRKLSRNERFIRPAAELMEMGEPCEKIIAVIGMALKFQDVDGDDESSALTEILKNNNAEEATTKITSLTRDHPLFSLVVEQVKNAQ